MKVEQLLAAKSSRTVVRVTPNTAIAEAANLLTENRIGLAVVADATNEMLGVLSERDIVQSVADATTDIQSKNVADLMTTAVVTCTPEDDVRDVIRTMGEGGFRHLPVITEGQVSDVISKTDVLAHLIRELDPEERIAVLQTVLEGTAGVPWI